MISIVHSPDSDDYFFFWALREKLIDDEGLNFAFDTLPTDQLNRLALSGEGDLIAVSVAVLPFIAESYEILPHGASIGRGYGPMVVSTEPLAPFELNGSRVAVPGFNTTACKILLRFYPEAIPVEVPIEPFDAVYSLLRSGAVRAAVLIHEGQLEYRTRALNLVVSLGALWTENTGLPLPLGVNVIRRGLGKSKIEDVSRVVGRSIEYAMSHKAMVLPFLARLNRERGTGLTDEREIEKYLSLYANADSLELKADVLQALDEIEKDIKKR